MIHAQGSKVIVPFAPQSVATNATAAGTIDTLGYKYATVDVICDSAAAVSNNPATCKLAENDNTVVSSFADIGAFTGDDTTNGFTIPNANTSVPWVIRMCVDLTKRKRYLRLSVTSAGAATIHGSICHLSRGDDWPDTTTEAGVSALVKG